MSKTGTPTLKKIGESLHFRGEGFSISCMQNALKAYNDGKKTIKEWLQSKDIPIFLDTNVLLNIYMTAIPERESMLKFLEDNNERIYLTGRVQQEFDKHRLVFIDKYCKNLTVKASAVRNAIKSFDIQLASKASELRNALMVTEFIDSFPESDAKITALKNWFDTNNPITEDCKTELAKLDDIKNTFNTEYGKLYDRANLELHDPILETLSKTILQKERTPDEIKYTQDLFTKLQDRYNAKKSERAEYLRFPGSGENKEPEKKEEPWGDLLIYHEMISTMLTLGTDALFITNDSSKLDWMKKSSEPYGYYIADTYQNTGHILYILKYADFFAEDYNSAEFIEEDEDSIGVTTNSSTSISLLNDTTETGFKSITEEQFIAELRAYAEKKEESVSPNISKNSFIFNRLGNMGYQYSKSFKIYFKLLSDKKIEEYEVEREDHKIKCIKLKTV